MLEFIGLFYALELDSFPLSRTQKSPTKSKFTSAKTSLQPSLTLSLLIKNKFHLIETILLAVGLESSIVSFQDK